MNKKWLLFVAIGICALAGPASLAEDILPSSMGPREGFGPPACACGFNPDGDTFCALDTECSQLTACTVDTDCPAGFGCFVDNCCPGLEAGACLPKCDEVECINPGVCGAFEACEAPLYVELASFEAEWVDGRVSLTWTTASEIENAGFRILRARRDGSRIHKNNSGERELELSLELVTARLVPAQGDPLHGASYRYLDGAPHRPGTLTYYLVDVDYSGVATLHGPVHVEVPERTPPTRSGGRSR